MRPIQEFNIKVASLRRSAPREFDDMLVELKRHAEDQFRLCVQAPPDHLSRLQGRAQHALEMTTLFEDACKTADRIVTKQAESSAAVHRR